MSLVDSQPEKKYVKPGDVVRLKLPASEVCMYMRVTDKVMDVQVGFACLGAQLLKEDGSKFSMAIAMGEAGFYYDGVVKQWYCYPETPDVPGNVEEK